MKPRADLYEQRRPCAFDHGHVPSLTHALRALCASVATEVVP